jgi:hypothetical protein
MSDQLKPTPSHALAQSRAKTKLVKLHKDEYETLYRQECENLGLTNYPSKAERIAKLKEQLKKLEAGV